MSPDQIETITDATDLLVDQQDVTPLGLAYQAIELQTSEDAARRGAAPRPARDEGLTDGRRDRLPRRRRRDHLGRGADPGRAAAGRVALVLPSGSRIATSRINFRLLSRDALINEKQLADRGRRRGHPGARRVGRAAGLRVGRGVRGVARRDEPRRRRRRRPPVRRRRRSGRGRRRADATRTEAARRRTGEPADAGDAGARPRPATPARRSSRHDRPPGAPRPCRRRRRRRTDRGDRRRRRRHGPDRGPARHAASTATAGDRPWAGLARRVEAPGRHRGEPGPDRGGVAAADPDRRSRRSGSSWSSAASAPTSSCRRRRSSSRRRPGALGPGRHHGHRRPERDRARCRRAGRPGRGRARRRDHERHVRRDRQAGRGDQGDGHGPLLEPRLPAHQHDPGREHRQHQRGRPVPDHRHDHRPAGRSRRPHGLPGPRAS